jgi:hypothetical protein
MRPNVGRASVERPTGRSRRPNADVPKQSGASSSTPVSGSTCVTSPTGPVGFCFAFDALRACVKAQRWTDGLGFEGGRTTRWPASSAPAKVVDEVVVIVDRARTTRSPVVVGIGGATRRTRCRAIGVAA